MNYLEVLEELQDIQYDNIGVVDCHIETRKDQNCTQILFSACNYGFTDDNKIDDKNKSKLHVYKFKWKNNNDSDEAKLKLIKEDMKILRDKYSDK